MDSHYDQVMKARSTADTAASKLYFAYSTILDRAAFEEWRGQHSYDFFELPEGKLAEALDVDLVYDFPSRWWGGRVAGLKDAPGTSVHGRLTTSLAWAITFDYDQSLVTGQPPLSECRFETFLEHPPQDCNGTCSSSA